MTHSPMGTINPDCSAIGTKSAGEIKVPPLLAVIRLEPAQQGFRADDFPRLQIKLRLIIQLQLFLLHGFAQVAQHLEALLDGTVEILRIFLDQVAASDTPGSLW